MNLTGLLAAVLRGDRAAAAALVHVPPDRIERAARRHGVLPLVVHRLSSLAPDLAGALRAAGEGEVAADLYREAELARVLAGFAASGVRAVVLKGAALAYTDYERPDLRARDDSDVLIAEDARAAADAVLIACGYRQEAYVAGDLVNAQAAYTRRLDGVTLHTIDLHWRIANPHLFARVLTFDELWRDAVPLAPLGPAARGPSGAHALFLSCVHRVAHHRDADLLVWLYDIHRLMARLTSGEWERFAGLATAREMAAICLQGLRRAVEAFGGEVPPFVEARLVDAAKAPEASTSFLSNDRPQLATLVSDLRALRSWRDRARLVREHLLPSADYMRNTYAPSSRAPLPALYLWRVMHGAWRWLRPGVRDGV